MKHPETDIEFRDELCAWLRSNGIDPGRMPMGRTVSLVDDQLTYEQTVLDENGRVRTDPPGFGVLTSTVTVTITVEPPPDVAEWLSPRCPTCGR